MSLTKKYIEEEMERGNDVLHPNSQHSDDEYNYALFKQTQEQEWCYYSGMPSPKAYEEPQPIEFDDDSTDDDEEYNPPADRNIGDGYVDYTEDE